MAAANIKASLLAAETAINAGEYKEALQHCKAALKADKKSHDALFLIGRAAYHMGEYDQAELGYRRALEAKPGFLKAWEGLVELFATTNNVLGEIEANEQLLQQTTEEDPRDRAARLRLANAYGRAGSLDLAVQQYLQVLSADPPAAPDRVDILCGLADVMLRRDEVAVNHEVQKTLDSRIKPTTTSSTTTTSSSTVDPKTTTTAVYRTMSCLELDILAARAAQDSEAVGEASVFMVLSEIADLAPASLKYLSYREEYIRRCLLRIFHAPPRSTERQQFRLTALRECVSVICHGGSCSPLPFEAAVWLLEEEEEIKGGQVSVGGQEVGGTQALAGGVQAGAEGHIGAGRQATVALAAENFSRRLVHQFPSHATSRVLLALMLRRHALHAGRPVSQSQRRQLEKLLAAAMVDGAAIDCASGYKALAELQYENRNYENAVDTSVRGLRWLQQRRERGHEALTQVALGLRLVLAKSLRRLERLDEAERHFKSLAGWVTEGEAAFSEMCGSTPTSIHQQALRGIALVALARGDISAARAQYERILGKAALGRGPAEHWAHADYGWLLYQNGDFQGARFHLEQALHVAEEEGCAATDSQLGEHRYRLGEVYWKLKGRYRSEKQFAYTQFYESAKVEGHAQAPALAALGRYFEQVEKRPDAAQRCFKKALSIDPSVDVAGDLLCAQLVETGRKEAAIALCKEISNRTPQATWAWKRLGILLLDQNQPQEAIAALQIALRTAPGDASSWEALGAAYQPLGRLTAAIKAYNRALELDNTRIYSLIQSGNLYLTMGNPEKALHRHEAALQLDSHHPAALLGAAEALTASARVYIREGALVAAAKGLQRAATFAETCAKENGNLISAWKQLGDVLLLAQNAPPSRDDAALLEQGAAGVVSGVYDRFQAVQRSRSAYSKALFLNPSSASSWHDVACTYHAEAQLHRTTNIAALLKHNNTPSQNKRKRILSSYKVLVTQGQRYLCGAVRIDPGSAELWMALGMLAPDASAKEYALSRSLQLDPRCSTAWVALARLYIDAGEAALAERCLQQGRSHDPAVGLIWEAMASVAALSPSPTAQKESINFSEHAVGLGAGAEGLLVFAEASLMKRLKNEDVDVGGGNIYAVARKAAELDACNPAALNVWGLACEVKGDGVGAVRAYKTALELLLLQASSSVAENGKNEGEEDEIVLLHRHPSMTKPTSTDGGGGGDGLPLATAVKLNLARALCVHGSTNSDDDESKNNNFLTEALDLYRQLESERVLDTQPHAWLSYAVVRAQTGDHQGAENAAQRAFESANGDGNLGAAAVEVLMQLKIVQQGGGSRDAFDVLQVYLQRLQDWQAPIEEIMKFWCIAVTAAAVVTSSGDDTTSATTLLTVVQEIVTAATSWAATTTTDTHQSDAEFLGKLQNLLASADFIHLKTPNTTFMTTPKKILAKFAKAVHTCPSSAELRLSLASIAVDISSTYSPSVLRLLRATRSDDDNKENMLNSGLEAATASLLACGVTAGVDAAQFQLKEISRAIHAHSNDVTRWYVAALVAAQVAAGEQTVGAHKKAIRLSECALSLLEKKNSRQNSSSSNSTTIDYDWAAVRLLVCMSESLAWLESQNLVEEKKALTIALSAVNRASSSTSSSSTTTTAAAAALRQVARCHWAAVDMQQAESFYMRALEEERSGEKDKQVSGGVCGALTAIELARCLQSSGRGQDAVAVLTEEAQRLQSQPHPNNHHHHHSKLALEQLLLQKTLTLVHLNELEAAKLCAQKATTTTSNSSSCSSISGSDGVGLILQGAISLHQNVAVVTNNPPTTTADTTSTSSAVSSFIGDARRSLSEALQKGHDGVIVRALLAHVEVLGSMRKKEERVAAHIEEALALSCRPIPGELLEVLGRLHLNGALGKVLLSKAVHDSPWKAAWWEELQQRNTGGGGVDTG